MKSISLFILLLLLSTSLLVAGSGKKYGKSISSKKQVAVSDILATPEKFAGKRVVVEGTIADVCQNMGCWINITSDKDSSFIRFKVNDGDIIFPVTAKGKSVRAQGVVSVKVQSVEEQIMVGKEMASDSKTTFDTTTVTGPKKVVTIKGEGAVIK